MLAIHSIHRELANWALQNLPKEAKCIGEIEIKLLFGLLRKNMMMIANLDLLKEATLIAHELGDFEWEQELCMEIEKLEIQMM
ncbi:hypothetical protein AB4114_11285 [Paenibacillus sp. 2RAB27]|uniref:DUF7667 family protein n=1 Tax=Paenibacillus sp. 2RAB27 TaxID=3232991 RepID=UPI003F9907C0